MSLLNTEELKRQIKEGTLTSLDDITNGECKSNCVNSKN